MKTINTVELKFKMNGDTPFTLVNVQDQAHFDQAHIPGSINIPETDIASKAAAQLPDKNAEILLYCSGLSCEASSNAAAKLEKIGYQNITAYKFGVQGWKEAGYALEEPKRIAG
jgi:rhodanese-related sulfurtransferase